MAWARTVAVVVPSPARSEVLVATSLTIWAPMFSIGSASSISLATVTPSLVMVGEPNFLSMTTFRPLGPRVTFTASASWSTPFLSLARASTLNSSSFDAMVRISYGGVGRSADLGEDVRGLDDDHFIVAELERGAAVLAVDDLVAHGEFHRDPGALVHPARPDGDHFALGRLFLGGIGDVQPAAHRLRFLGGHDHDTVFERLDAELWLALGRSGHRLPPATLGVDISA